MDGGGREERGRRECRDEKAINRDLDDVIPDSKCWAEGEGQSADVCNFRFKWQRFTSSVSGTG